MTRTPSNSTIAIIGLGYVGLPLAVEFGKRIPVPGFDIKHAQVDELNGRHYRTCKLAASNLTEPEHVRTKMLTA